MEEYNREKKGTIWAWVARQARAKCHVDGPTLVILGHMLNTNIQIISGDDIWNSDDFLDDELVFVYLCDQKFGPTEVGTYFSLTYL